MGILNFSYLYTKIMLYNSMLQLMSLANSFVLALRYAIKDSAVWSR